mgnify:CR=1 FL=1
MATTAYIMIETNIGMVKDVANSLRAVPGVSEVDVSLGRTTSSRKSLQI